MRRAFVDLGANTGAVSRRFAEQKPEHDIYCVEPNKSLIHHITNAGFQAGRTFITMWAAAWICDGFVDLYGSGAHAASTIVQGKVEHSGWPQIDYKSPMRVPCFDFSAWLLRTFSIEDDVTIKMDIEGAEYAILRRMITDRSVMIPRKIVLEWHQDRYPGVSRSEHNDLRDKLKSLNVLEEWK